MGSIMRISISYFFTVDKPVHEMRKISEIKVVGPIC